MKSAFLIAAFPFVLPCILTLIVGIVLAFTDPHDAMRLSGQTFSFSLIGMAAFTLIWLPIGYLINQWVIDKATGARLLGRHEKPRLWSIFEPLCAKAGLRLPTLRIIESDVMNAYASGLREGSYSVTVTKGLFEALADDELEGVLAHELTHILNRDVRLMVVAAVLVGAIPMLHDLVMKAFWAIVMTILNIYRAMFLLLPAPGAKFLAEVSYRGLYWVGKLVAYAIGLVSTVCSLVIQFAISRTREFMADAGAAKLTGKPEALIAALQRISGRSHLETAIAGVRPMLFDNAVFGLGGLFATHPPIEARIEALRRIAEDRRRPTTLMRSNPEPAPGVAAAPRDKAVRQLPVAGLGLVTADVEPRGAQPDPSIDARPPPVSLEADPVRVARYRQILMGARPERLTPLERQQLYGRARQVVERAETDPTLAEAQPAVAKLSLERAIADIEAALRP